MQNINDEILWFTVAGDSPHATPQVLFFRMNSLQDRIKRREACFGEAWSKLKEMGFEQKAELPQFADYPFSPSLFTDVPQSPALSRRFFGGQNLDADVFQTSEQRDNGSTVLSSSSASYQDDDIYLHLPSEMRRALVRTKHVPRRRPIVCRADQPQRRLLGDHEASSNLTAEFRRCMVEKYPQSYQCTASSPGEDDGVMWDEAKKTIMALRRSPSTDDPDHLHLGHPGKNRPPMHSRQSTFSDSECVLDGPALFHGYSPVMPQTPYVTLNDLPPRIRDILSQSAYEHCPVVSSAESHSSTVFHDDIPRAYHALRDAQALPDYFGDWHRYSPT